MTAVRNVVVGAYESVGGVPWVVGRAYIFSGNGGELLYTLLSPNPEQAGDFGCSVSSAGDVNDDGRADVVVGAKWEDGGSWNAGRVYVLTPVIMVSGQLLGRQLVLEWGAWPGADAYWLYGADNVAYFEPGLASPYQYRLQVLPSETTTWSGSNGIGDSDHNWTYMVIAMDAGEQELCRSNRFGERDSEGNIP